MDLLRLRYPDGAGMAGAQRFVRAEHVRYIHRHGYTQRVADYIVVDTWNSTRLLGFEIKTSRSDWLRELRDLGPYTCKHVWAQHCHEWYLVAADKNIVRDDLPQGWGLLAPDKTGKLRQFAKPALTDNPVPIDMWNIGSLSRAINLTAARDAMLH